ncbi:MAG: 8-amino-7-oxononanoate synthase [Planctomycetaceae bacterium]
MDWLGEESRRIQQEGLWRARNAVTPLSGGRCRRNGKTLVDFSTNDYLNLAGDERVIEAARTALADVGCGSRASALVSGRTEWHAQLEERLAQFEGQESAILFPTGYAANVGTISTLIGSDDIIFCDRLNHASLLDGCRQSGAKLRVYRHNELKKLEDQLANSSGKFRRCWIITDGVFSMEGDIAPLELLCDLAKQFDAHVLVDEAHGTGVFGKKGRGVAEFLNVENDIAVRTGTLSKAIGCLGGFVAGPRELTDFLWNTARPQMFSTALPPPICAAATAALDVIAADPERRTRLHVVSAYLREQLQTRGLQIPNGCASPIVPVIIGDPKRTVAVGQLLEERGFLVAAIRPPTVPQNSSRLRISITAAHTEEQIDQLTDALVKFLRDN